MCGGFRGNTHTDSTEVGPGIHSNQRVSNPSHHLGESNECLCVLPVSEETVAFQDGRLYKTGKVRENKTCVVVFGGGRVCVCVGVFGGGGGGGGGYNLGMSSLMEAILKNQLRHVSLPDSGTCSEVKSSVTMKTTNVKIII